MKELQPSLEQTKQTIVERIFRYAKDSPEKAAIICKDEITTYRDLAELIFSVSLFLKKEGIEKGARVAVQALHDKHCIALYYAIHLVGAILVPLEKNAPEFRVREIVSDTGSKLVFSNLSVDDQNWHTYAEIEKVCEKKIEYSYDDLAFPDIDDLCEMVFTTGTTGKSKGVLIRHSNISWYAYALAKAIHMKEDNRFFITTPLNHAGGLRRTHLSLANGCALIYMDGLLNLKKYFDYIERYHATALYLPPVAIRLLINSTKDELHRFADQIDFVYSSSSPLPIGDCEELKKLLPNTRLYNAYEASETPGVSVYDYNSDRILHNCMGQPNPGVELGILDENGSIVKDAGTEGQICVRSPMNMAGYYNAPDLTAQVMNGDWYVSSDLGVFDEEGNIYYNGRKGDVINIGGYKISPIDVEETALLSGMLKECICILSENRQGYPILKLLVVPQEDEYDPKVLIRFIGSRLEPYKVPKEVEVIDEVHKTFNGKLDRKYYRK